MKVQVQWQDSNKQGMLKPMFSLFKTKEWENSEEGIKLHICMLRWSSEQHRLPNYTARYTITSVYLILASESDL